MINADFIQFLKDRLADEKYMAFLFREKSSQELVDRIPIELSIDDVEVEGDNVVSVARFTHNPSIVTFKEDTMPCDDHVSLIDESSDEDSIFQSIDDDEEYLLKRKDELNVNDYEIESDESDDYGASNYDRFYEEFNYDDNSSMNVEFSDDNSMYVNFSDNE